MELNFSETTKDKGPRVRIHIHHDRKNTLTIELSPSMEQMLDLFKKEIPMAVLAAKVETVDTVNDEGEVFKNCKRYTITCSEDEVAFFFEATQMVIRKKIQESIGHKEN